NDSTGEGDNGEIDARGPWNEGNGWVYRESPAFEELQPHADGNGNGNSNGTKKPLKKRALR
ncbi:MAG TPA: manganese catalase family protein, partial [Pirellulales bacterium]|nr:manganese catalase family protein [Pirellulales bacterium]